MRLLMGKREYQTTKRGEPAQSMPLAGVMFHMKHRDRAGLDEMNPRERIRGEGATLLQAIESALNNLMRSSDAVVPERWARIQVNADSVEAAVLRVIDAIAGAAEDFGQAPARVELDGIRPNEDGWRIWGRLGLSDVEEGVLPRADEMAVTIRGDAVRQIVEIVLLRGSL